MIFVTQKFFLPLVFLFFIPIGHFLQYELSCGHAVSFSLLSFYGSFGVGSKYKVDIIFVCLLKSLVCTKFIFIRMLFTNTKRGKRLNPLRMKFVIKRTLFHDSIKHQSTEMDENITVAKIVLTYRKVTSNETAINRKLLIFFVINLKDGSITFLLKF